VGRCWELTEAGAAIGEGAMQEAVGCALDATGEARSRSSAAEVMGVKRANAADSDVPLLGRVFHCTGSASQVRAASESSWEGR
jgi:hypothetical protein